MRPDKPQQQSFKGQIASFKHAFEGIGSAFSELHMKIHLGFAVFALVACAVLRVDVVGWCLVIVCIGCVFSAEVLNTAIEALCDKVSPEIDPRIKVAKDAAAGAVLILAIMAVVVGLIVYIHALLRLLGWI